MSKNNHRFISTDSHLVIARNEDFAPLKKIYGEKAPHIIRGEDNCDYLMLDGLPPYNLIAEGPMLANKVTHNNPSPSQGPVFNLDDAHWSTFEPEARIKAQDEDNIAADVMYAGQFGLMALQVPDEKYRFSLAQFWNDYAAEFCAYNPDRLIAHAMVPVNSNVDESIKELERAKGLGFKCVHLPESEEWRLYSTDYWDPLIEAMCDLDMIGGIHVAANTRYEDNFVAKAQKHGMFYVLAQHHSFIETVADLVFSGKLQKHPNFKVVLAEGGLAWVADALNFLDTLYHEYPEEAKGLIPEGDKPSDVYNRHFYSTFQVDPVGLAVKDFLNLDRVMWASDFPHCEGTFPHSKKIVEEGFADYLTPEEMHKVTYQNAANLYGITAV